MLVALRSSPGASHTRGDEAAVARASAAAVLALHAVRQAHA